MARLMYMCVSGLPTDPKYFIVNFEETMVKYAEKWGEM